MTLLIRKISLAKWMQNKILDGEEISADAITGCMRTNDNALSAWKITNEDEIEEAILAIVSKYKKPDKTDVVSIEPEFLNDNKFMLNETSGNTPVIDLRNKHVDISKFNYKSLGVLGNYIVKRIKEEKVMTFTSGHIKRIIKKAIELNRVKREDLEESLIKKVLNQS